MIEYQIDTSELVRMAAIIPKMGPIIGEEIDKAMVESGMLLTTLVASRIAATSKNTGLLEAAVSFPEGFTVEGDPMATYEGTIAASKKMTLYGVATNIYANYVEFGTRPHWPPIAPLEYWVSRKFGLSGDEAKSAAFAVATTIAHRGTYAKANFFLAWHYDGGRRKVTGIWRKVPARVVKRWSEVVR